eukprot:CFRG5303T1
MTVITVAESAAELSTKLARYVKDISVSAITANGRFTVAISGGSLPKTLGQGLIALINSEEGKQIDLSKWQVFYADERNVPLDDKDSNHLECVNQLYKHLNIPEGNIHTIEYTRDVQAAATAYEHSLQRVFGTVDVSNPPHFDLILLGMGPDGHTLSLFPGHALLNEKSVLVAPISDSPKPPSQRITLTFPVCEAAHNIAFVTTGDAKKDVIFNIHREGNSQQNVAGLVTCQNKEGVVWFMDAGAASLL